VDERLIGGLDLAFRPRLQIACEQS
jgi:hypothetical protein